MTRVVAGSAGGRRLVVPPGRATRPTSDRAREGLFSALEALRGPLTGARVLDLYAGTGAVGIEALSRGAAHVCFVESDETAVAVIRRNLDVLGLAGAVVRHQRIEKFVTTTPDGPAYGICFADPPYAEDAGHVVTNLLAITEHWLSHDAVVVVERSSRDPEWTWPVGLSAVRSRKYGDATLWYGRRS